MANQSPVEICNQALSWLGSDPITSQEFDSPSSKAAQLCKANYEPLRDAVLEDHPWSFAIRRQNLAPLNNSSQHPVNINYGDFNAFHLPADCLRILDASRTGNFDPHDLFEDWTLEDRAVVTRAGSVFIRYIGRIKDTGHMSPMFVQALAARMAMDLAVPLTNSRVMLESMSSLYGAKLADARTSDGLQGSDRPIQSSWLRRARMQ